MQTWLPWILTTVALGAAFACVLLSRKQEGYIRDNYPHLWQRASSNPMKMKLSRVRTLALNDAVNHGELCGKKDATLRGLWRKQKALMGIGLAAVAVNIVIAFAIS